jgi:hypothetical protein
MPIRSCLGIVGILLCEQNRVLGVRHFHEMAGVRRLALAKAYAPGTVCRIAVWNQALRGLVSFVFRLEFVNDWEKTPSGGVFSLDWQLTLSLMT